MLYFYYNLLLIALMMGNDHNEGQHENNSQMLEQQNSNQIKLQQIPRDINLRKSKSDDFICARISSHSTENEIKMIHYAEKLAKYLFTKKISKRQLHKKKSFKKGNTKKIVNSNQLKSDRKKGQLDYRKNICGYITKKIIREFLNFDYQQKVEQLCKKYECKYNQVKIYYSNKIQKVTGPSHLPGLLVPENQTEVKLKSVFRQFFQWFLNQKYLRYILIQGKMTNKRAYIEYKNNTLLSLIRLMGGINKCNNLQVKTEIKVQTQQNGRQQIVKRQQNCFGEEARCATAMQQQIAHKIEEQYKQFYNHFITYPHLYGFGHANMCKQQQIMNQCQEKELERTSLMGMANMGATEYIKVQQYKQIVGNNEEDPNTHNNNSQQLQANKSVLVPIAVRQNSDLLIKVQQL